jgi:Ca-activated chloride channel family protein
MAFENIRITGLMIFIPIYWWLSWHSFRKARAWRYEFSRRIKPLQPFLFTEIFVSLTMIAVLLALAGPKVQYEKNVFDRSGIQLVLGIDVSKSMLAEDAALGGEGDQLFPIRNRLNRARYVALNFLSDLHGERVGAFVFSGNGVEVIPLTRDYGYGRYVLRHINPGDVTSPGSDLGAAIRTGIAMFESAETSGIKRMILLSDGEDISPDKSTIYESAKSAAQKGIRIYTVGIGMPKGVLIPMRDHSGEIQDYYSAEDGSNLKTRLEQEPLKMIANLTGGTDVLDSKTTYWELLNLILKESRGYAETQTIETAWMDISPFLLLAGFCFLAAAAGGPPLLEKHYNRID